MGEMEEERWNEFARTIDWASPLDVCMKNVGLLGEPAMEECKDVMGSDDDNEVVTYTLEASMWEPRGRSHA